MSQKGMELDYAVQGTDKQKSIMSTISFQLQTNANRFTALTGSKSVNGETVETQGQTHMTKKGRVKKFILAIANSTTNVVTTITLRKNGVDAVPAVVFTLPAGNSVNQEIDETVEFEEKDFLGWHYENAAGSGVMETVLSCQVELDA